MDSQIAFEIEWRESLVKRLKNAQASLRKDKTAEESQRQEARQLAAFGYSSYEEAHEAYGWGEITEAQLEAIKAELENRDTVAGHALRRMNDIIGNIKGEIMMLKRDPDYREEFMK